MENDGVTLRDMNPVDFEREPTSRARAYLGRVVSFVPFFKVDQSEAEREFRGIEKKCTPGLTVFGITLLPQVKPSPEDIQAVERIRLAAQAIGNYCNYPQARGLNSRTVLLRLDIERFYRHYGIGR